QGGEVIRQAERRIAQVLELASALGPLGRGAGRPRIDAEPERLHTAARDRCGASRATAITPAMIAQAVRSRRSGRIGMRTLTASLDCRYRSAMASALEREATTRRWRRVEYERLVDLGVFMGEHLELLDGVLVVREPQGSPHAAIATKVGRLLAAAFGGAWHPRPPSPLALGEA